MQLSLSTQRSNILSAVQQIRIKRKSQSLDLYIVHVTIHQVRQRPVCHINTTHTNIEFIEHAEQECNPRKAEATERKR